MEAIREREGEDGALMRRLNIVYFLSRNGKIEQPHLITVYHPNNNGVHLRDFKRWLFELRGREMSESFFWSFKRTYKIGYIWQDLIEDDLIIPISDCEYVLMGSLLFSPIKIIEKLKDEEEEAKFLSTSMILKSPFETFQINNNVSPKPLAEVDKESSIETSALTSSSFEKEEGKNVVLKIDFWNEEKKRNKNQRHEEIVSKVNEQKLNGASSSFEKAKKKTVRFMIDSEREEIKEIKMLRNEEIVPKENGRQFNGTSSSSEKAKRKTTIFNIFSWRKEMNRIKKQKHEKILPKENGRQLNEVKGNESNGDGTHHWASVMRNLLRCRM